MSQDWRHKAACKDMPLSLFFAADGERQVEREIREARAKLVCEGCPVRDECLDFAYGDPLGRKPEMHGVWGGEGEEERAKGRRNSRRRVALGGRNEH